MELYGGEGEAGVFCTGTGCLCIRDPCLCFAGNHISVIQWYRDLAKLGPGSRLRLEQTSPLQQQL